MLFYCVHCPFFCNFHLISKAFPEMFMFLEEKKQLYYPSIMEETNLSSWNKSKHGLREIIRYSPLRLLHLGVKALYFSVLFIFFFFFSFSFPLFFLFVSFSPSTFVFFEDGWRAPLVGPTYWFSLCCFCLSILLFPLIYWRLLCGFASVYSNEKCFLCLSVALLSYLPCFLTPLLLSSTPYPSSPPLLFSHKHCVKLTWLSALVLDHWQLFLASQNINYTLYSCMIKSFVCLV